METTPRVIREDELYTLEEFKGRMGIKKAAWRTMRRQGLPVLRIGQRGYVDGRQAIDHIRTHNGGEQQ